MATIIERKRKDGSIAYVAQIFIKKKGQESYREARTFDKRSAANAWAKKRTKEVEAAGDDLSSLKSRGQTLRDAIQRYTEESLKEIGRTKAQVLNTILEFDIADMACEKVQSHDIVDFVRQLSVSRSPSTVGNYPSHLGAIFAISRPAWGCP